MLTILRVLMLVAFVVPVFVVMLSLLLSVYLLLFKTKSLYRMQSVGQAALYRSRLRASVTILIFTCVYLVFNIPQAVKHLAQHLSAYLGIPFQRQIFSFDYEDSELNAYFTNFVHVLSLAMNSGINPVIYYWRLPGMGRFLRGLTRSGRRTAGNVSATRKSSIPVKSTTSGNASASLQLSVKTAAPPV